MKLLAISDIDDLGWNYGDIRADILISCGDVSDEAILEAAEACKCDTILAVKGNHDREVPFPSPIIDIHHRTYNHNGLTFGGFNGCWKYKPRGHFLYEQQEVETLLSDFPPLDVFIAHNSPRGIHDKDDDVHYGFEAFNRYIKRAQPNLNKPG